MNTVTVTLGGLIDRTLEEVQSAAELGRTAVRVEALGPTDTTCTFVDGSYVNRSDILEFDSELVLVTDKTADPTPVFTLSRGYYGTTAAAHNSNQVGTLNPQWNRKRVAGAVRRAFPRLEAYGVVVVETEKVVAIDEVGGNGFRTVLPVPENCRTVLSVRDSLVELERWEFLDDMPTVDYPTGKVIRLPWRARLADEFAVTYRIPYRWSTHPSEPDEDSTIVVPEGAEDLPASYAAAWLVGAREVSRSEIDRVGEWQGGEPMRGGVSGGVLRAMWQRFYQSLDEVRRLDPPQQRRPYIRRRGSY